MSETGGRTDEAKGRVKEAAGSLLDDEELRREGRTDQAAGKLKRKAEELIDRVRNALRGGDDTQARGDDR